MSQIFSVLEKEVQACVRMASIFDDEMRKFGHTLRAGRFSRPSASKMLETANRSLRFSPNMAANSPPS